MLRRLAFLSLVLAACVGDDPASPAAPDASVSPDGGSSGGSDAGSGTDSGSSGDVDAGADATTNCIPNTSGIVSWWTGDDTSNDKLGLNHLVIAAEGGTIGYASGRVGNGFSFTAGAHLESSPAMGVDALVGLTVEAWVIAGDNQNNRIVDHSTAGTSDGWLFDLYLSKLRLLVAGVNIQSQGQFPLQQLTHVAGTFDGTVFRLFVDGQKENEATVAATAIPSPNLPLRVGGGDVPNVRWKGVLDEVSIYSRALSPNEIKAIYEAGANGRCK
jgi:hypothetical protein